MIIFCLIQVQSPCLFYLVMLSHPIKLQIIFIQLEIEFLFDLLLPYLSLKKNLPNNLLLIQKNWLDPIYCGTCCETRQ